MSEVTPEYIIDSDEKPHPTRYTPWKCPNCGKVLGYCYKDSSGVSRLLVSREDSVVYHIIAADVRCTCWADIVKFRIDPRMMENLS